MFSTLYNLFLMLTSPLWLVYLLWRIVVRGKSREGWSQRLGGLPVSPQGRRTIWVHAVSVGEVIAALPLLQSLREEFPEHYLLLTTLTPAGNAIARQHLGKLIDAVGYLPVDLPFAVKRALQRVSPDALIVMETELWPNLLTIAYRRGVRTFIANGRLSDRSLPTYRRFRWFFAQVLRCIDAICAQSEEDARRFCAIGAPPDRVHVVGNTKFDQAAVGAQEVDVDLLRRDLGLPEGTPVLVIGSSRAPEEEVLIAKAYRRLREQFPTLCIVWAPRHVERAETVADVLRAEGFHPWFRTQGVPDSPQGQIVLDTFGELARVYAIGDVAIIGGSFVPLGGQNLLQPLAHGKPVVHGPYMHNFRDVAALARQAGVAWTAHSEEELVQHVSRLLRDERLRAEVARRAQTLVREQQGASQRITEILKAFMIW
ncbi:MAG: 3-deoxy-D-manno-octulosonic acid transferase [Armatimonadota bacterium]|nr:3-deoxy-D-manno-octulosonic acid transferase [bacterium]MDW8321079.1 3-deoxy-D-manno-octulosonic acid transferase [Armatimonadota bacterium]